MRRTFVLWCLLCCLFVLSSLKNTGCFQFGSLPFCLTLCCWRSEQLTDSTDTSNFCFVGPKKMSITPVYLKIFKCVSLLLFPYRLTPELQSCPSQHTQVEQHWSEILEQSCLVGFGNSRSCVCCAWLSGQVGIEMGSS